MLGKIFRLIITVVIVIIVLTTILVLGTIFIGKRMDPIPTTDDYLSGKVDLSKHQMQ